MLILRIVFVIVLIQLLASCSFDLNSLQSIQFKQSYCLIQSQSFSKETIDSCQFQPYENQKIEFNKQHDLAIFKLSELDVTDSMDQPIVVVDFKYFQKVSYFSKDTSGTIRTNETMSRKVATKNRLFSSEHYVFDFDTPAKEHFILIKNNLTVAALIKLVDKKEYIVFDRNIIIFFTILYTSMFGLFLVNFIFYLYIKNKTYLYYSIFIISALNTIFWFEGRFIDFRLYSISTFVQQINQYSFLFSNAILYLFLYHFLKLNLSKKLEAKIVYWLIIHVCIQLVLLFLVDIVGYQHGADLLATWNNLTIQIANVSILWIAWIVYKNGNRQAGFLLISWSLFIAFSSMRLYFVLNPAPNQFWLQHAHEIGVLIDAFVLALALADQSLTYKKSSELAQINYLKANRALLGETLINNFLHEIKAELMPKSKVHNFVSEIEQKFAQMIIKYAPMQNVQRLSVLDKKIESTVIYENNDDYVLKDYLNQYISTIGQKCYEKKVNYQVFSLNNNSCQFIMLPLIKAYQNEKYDNECLLIQLQSKNYLEEGEINDLVAFIDKSLQALIDSKELQDISKHAQDIMTVAKEKEKAMKLKDRFFANVSHEFRTPLSLTIAPLQDLNKQKEFLNTSGRYLAETALSNARDLLRLVDNVLDIQKLETNIFPLQVSKTNLNKMIYTEIKRLKTWALDKNQNLGFNKFYEDDFFIYCDQKEVGKIISNLISNAIKYCGQDTNIVLSVESEGSWIKVLVADDGRGIEEEIQDKLFDRYYQGQSFQHALEAGSGIGLSFVKDIMKLHCGYVTLESQLGEGTLFILWFKKGFEHFDYDDLIEAQDKDQFKEKEKLKEKKITQKLVKEVSKTKSKKDKTTVLIVEDNSELRKYLTFKLSYKFKILQAENGKKGLEIAKKHLPDLIISDVMMPEMDGIDMVTSIRKDKMLETIPVIMLTAKTQKNDTVLGLKAGADDYISKPFDFDELDARLNRLLESRKIIRKQIKHKYKDNSKVVKSSFQEKLDEMIILNISHVDLNVDFLAEKLFINRSSLYRKIKKEFNKTPIAYIRKIKMKYALDLLKDKKINVSETAYACGFESLSYFSKQFKKTYGKSPSDVL
jgi:signal transduction histidine kinase/DNA-binding response OmpR family regulator